MAKVANKTILGKAILKFEFSKMKVARLYEEKIFGWITLEGGERIQIENGKYFIVNKEGQKSGVILNTNPAFRKIKRLIARWFTTYRNGERGGKMHHVGYWRSRVIDGMHDANIFKYSGISFKENKSNFLRLAS